MRLCMCEQCIEYEETFCAHRGRKNTAFNEQNSINLIYFIFSLQYQLHY